MTELSMERQTLATLQRSYNNKHPDVQASTKKIEGLEKRLRGLGYIVTVPAYFTERERA